MKVSYKIPLADPGIGEEEAKAVFEVVKSGWIRQGQKVEEFERKFARYLGIKHAVATSSGTTALHVALAALGIKKNDEVIMPSFTCIPPASMTILLGGIPVFADIEPSTYNIDPISIERLITERTKVIIPINYAGHPSDLKAIQEIANKYGLKILNDAAEALGAYCDGKNIASFGDVAIFSFSPNKTITTGEGGMITTNDDEIAEKARIIRDYGQKERFRYVELGSNYHMTEMQAAIGIVQLNKIDEIVKRKRKNAQMLTEKLSKIEGLTPPVELPDYRHAYMLYSIRVKPVKRDYLGKQLEERGIQNRVYFPPVHWSPLLKRFKYRRDKLKITDEVGNSILSLPSSPFLTEDEIGYIATSIRKCLED
jgi:perosamine synthetase